MEPARPTPKAQGVETRRTPAVAHSTPLRFVPSRRGRGCVSHPEVLRGCRGWSRACSLQLTSGVGMSLEPLQCTGWRCLHGTPRVPLVYPPHLFCFLLPYAKIARNRKWRRPCPEREGATSQCQEKNKLEELSAPPGSPGAGLGTRFLPRCCHQEGGAFKGKFYFQHTQRRTVTKTAGSRKTSPRLSPRSGPATDARGSPARLTPAAARHGLQQQQDSSALRFNGNC